MTTIVAHRGPDDEGLFQVGKVGLGHRRLSIIDLSALGHQPMSDVKGKAVIVYNGEIYNFLEIREELLSMGYQFASRTDTEVIVNAYIAWGEECLARFNGMFAFAIWDKLKNYLFLARDRLGIKPLYFYHDSRVFLFGSEIKSILTWPRLQRQVNPRALDYYFTFRFNHLDETLFQNISKVPPGYWLKVSLNSDERITLVRKQYWDVSSTPSTSDPQAIENELAAEIRRSVRYQMVSDVPVGTFLSSGVDSSTITGIMAKEFGRKVKTFTVGFDYEGFEDELAPVRFTSRHFKTEHTEYICKPDVVSLLPKIIWFTDELNADPALIPTYLISKSAGQKVKVVLSGEGSDEIFGGYERTMMIKYAWLLSRKTPLAMNIIPAVANMIPGQMLDRIFKYSSAIGQKGLERLAGFCRNIDNLGSSYIDVACVFNQDEKRKLYGEGLRKQFHDENIAETISRCFFNEPIDSAEMLFSHLAKLELKTRLPNDLLAKVDTMTMAHSIEGRVPFLDHNLVEYAFSIPENQKIRYFREKYILRKAALRFLPRKIAYRRKDHFFVPIHLWLQNELKPLADKILTRENIRNTGYLNDDFVLFAYENYKNGALFYARQIWNILFFLIWHKLYIETDYFCSVPKENLILSNIFPSS